MAEPLDAGAKPLAPNTFRSIRLDPQKLAALAFSEFVKALLDELRLLKRERSAFYEELRRSNARWANGGRAVLAILGALALLLTSLAAAIRLAPDAVPFLGAAAQGGNAAANAGPDRGVLVAVLVIYAVMGAISFYERGSDKTTSYFRQIATILAIRDLWTKLQFSVLKELMALKDSTDATAADASRSRILALAETFCVDLDKVATGELAEFRTEFQASLVELDNASKKGTDDVTKQLEESAKAAEKAAQEAKTAAEKAASEAKAAAKALEDATKPGFLNLTVTGDFDDEVVISIAGTEAARSRGKAIAVERVPPGLKKIAARAMKGTKVLETAVVVDVKPGLQDVKLSLA